MYTVCPKCALTLVVTAADLRVAQGFVRCGRCSNVFNALARLSEDRGAAATGTASATLSQPAAAVPREPEPSVPEPSAAEPLPDSDSIPDSALEFDLDATDVSKVFVEQRPDPQWSAATGKFKALFRKNQDRAPAPRPAEPPQGRRLTDGAQSGTAARTPAALQTEAARTVPTESVQPGTARTATTQSGTAHAAPTQSVQPGTARTATTQSVQPGTARTAPTQSVQPAPAPPTQPSPRQPSAVAPTTGAASPASAPTAPGSAPRAADPPAADPSIVTQSDAAPQKIPTDEDLQFDIEVDAEFLAATTQFRPPSPAPLTAGIPGTATPTQINASTPLPAAARPVGASMAEASMGGASPTPEAAAGSAVPPQNVGIAETMADEIGDIPAGAVDRPALTPWWSAGTAALVLLLAVQVVNHYRHDLATRPSLYQPLTRLYSALGIPLVPRWNLAAYDVRQLGASADNANAGQITVRASVKNTAKQPQPLPLLRVTLQDRFGNRIAARDVPPKSYLPSAIPPSSFLSAGQRIDAEMAFVDPGANAVGFEIDACLPEPGGSVACANDASTH